MSLIVFVSMTPLDKGESVSPYVARALEIIHRSGLDYVLTPMGTIVEGPDWPEVMAVLQRAFASLQKDCRRISFVIKGDYRAGRSAGLQQKIRSVTARLSQPIRTTLTTAADEPERTPESAPDPAPKDE